MPRPTPAQLVYGSATVVCAAFALLALTGTRSTLGAAVIAVVSLALGTLVALLALLVPTATRRRARSASAVRAGGTARPSAIGRVSARANAAATAAVSTPHGSRGVSVAPAGRRVAEPSLHR